MSQLEIKLKKNQFVDSQGAGIEVDKSTILPGHIHIGIVDGGKAASVILTVKEAKAVAKAIYSITNPGGMII